MNWNAIGAVGVWFSGLATFFAVIVAFRSLNLAINHRLRIDCKFIPPYDEPYFNISIANTGTRELQIKTISLLDSNSICIYYISPDIFIKPGFSVEKVLSEFGTNKQSILQLLKKDQTPPYFYKIALTDSLGKTHIKQFSFNP